MRAHASSTIVAGLAVAGLLALSACSQGEDGAGATNGTDATTNGAATPGQTPASSGQTPAAGTSRPTATPTASPQDVTVDTCALKNGRAHVAATVKNVSSAPQTYVVAVEVNQGGKKVDGVALFVGNIAAGKTGKASETGNASLKGAVTCKVTSAQAVVG